MHVELTLKVIAMVIPISAELKALRMYVVACLKFAGRRKQILVHSDTRQLHGQRSEAVFFVGLPLNCRLQSLVCVRNERRLQND